MLPKDLLPPLKIIGVTYDSSFGIRAQPPAKPTIIVNLPENIERYTGLALIVRLLHVFLLKEQLELLSGNLEDGLAVRLVAPVLAEQRLRILDDLVVLLLHSLKVVVGVSIKVRHSP